MDKWEYLTEFVWADIKNTGWEEYRKEHWPKFQPEKFAPESMIPRLNMRGDAGWELVSMQPVYVGNNYDVGFPTGTGGAYWTHIYFCSWKRRITG